MDAQMIFKFSSTIVLFGWILLFFFPKYKYSQSIILNGLVVIFSILYTFLILKNINSFDINSFGSIESIRNLFQNDEALTAGWIHYLAFDLFVGSFIVRDGMTHQLNRWKYTIPLPFTFMFGPLGYLIYSLFKFFPLKK